MQKGEENYFFETFQGIIDSVIAEKRQNKKWEKKLNSFNAVVQFKLRITQDTHYSCHLVAKGGNYEMKPGPVDNYDLELAATPDDLMYFTNKTYSTVAMFLKKNKYGETRLKVKKGGRNLGKLLAVSKLLVLE
jgi:putative sterol carrier protein